MSLRETWWENNNNNKKLQLDLTLFWANQAITSMTHDLRYRYGNWERKEEIVKILTLTWVCQKFEIWETRKKNMYKWKLKHELIWFVQLFINIYVFILEIWCMIDDRLMIMIFNVLPFWFVVKFRKLLFHFVFWEWFHRPGWVWPLDLIKTSVCLIILIESVTDLKIWN